MDEAGALIRQGHVLLLALVLISATHACDLLDPESEHAVFFADSALEEAVRHAIAAQREGEMPEGPIVASDLQGITELRAGGREISHLTGLEHLKDLEVLSLVENRVQNLQPLSGLTQLRQLALSNNRISDLSPLTALDALEFLWLEANEITDLSPLRSLHGLDWLFLRENRIADLSPIADLTSLRYLDVAGNDVSRLDAVAGLTSLEILIAPDNRVDGVQAVRGHPSLRGLELARNNVRDVSPLLDVAVLEVVGLRENPLEVGAVCEDVPALTARGVTVRSAGPCPGGNADQDLFFVETDQDVYVAEVWPQDSGADRWVVRLDLEVAYMNHLEEPIYIHYCVRPQPPRRLDRYDDGTWKAAYEPAVLLCGGPGEVGAGEVVRRDWWVSGYNPGGSMYPIWQPGRDTVEGTYRIDWGGVWTGPSIDSETAPLARRVSQPFTILVAPS